MKRIAERTRQIGLRRVVYGSTSRIRKTGPPGEVPPSHAGRTPDHAATSRLTSVTAGHSARRSGSGLNVESQRANDQGETKSPQLG